MTSNPDNLDRILLEQDTLLPSSGFPWKWALPGIAALLVGVVMLCRLAVTTIHSMSQNAATGTDWLTWLFSSAQPAVLLRTQVAPVLLALAASFACVALCRRLAGGWSTR